MRDMGFTSLIFYALNLPGGTKTESPIRALRYFPPVPGTLHGYDKATVQHGTTTDAVEGGLSHVSSPFNFLSV